ncbi:MAG TPA: tRNA lysidine(34) synthetase TilS [Limnobacter sp.]|nr:tRNA lysidine(34) synthetase TilS [Limnobacter sp.]
MVGYSGGVDSTVLLHAMKTLGLPVHAVHVNHGLQAPADGWALHCKNQCEQWGVPFTGLIVEVNPGQQGQEGQARLARYRAIFDWMEAGGHQLLVCAHHRDDQLETILLQLFRGSGLRGVGGMRRLGPVGVDRHLHPGLLLGRPLLDCSKQEITAYAKAHQLEHVEDPSNTNTRYRRNWLRQELLPQLQDHFPQSPGALLRLADFFQAHYDQEDLQTAQNSGAAMLRGGLLHLPAWRGLDESTQINSLRQWLLAHGVRCGQRKLLELARQLRIEKGGIRAVAKGWQVRISRQQAQLQLNTLDKDSSLEQH